MKNILLIHTRYRNKGGEDIVVDQEAKILSKHFNVRTIFFSNRETKYLINPFFLFTSRSIESENKLRELIQEFNPDIAIVHNTWFNASLSIFDVLKEKKIKTFLKLHNFRYFCTNTIFHKKHLGINQVCPACGQERKKFRILNKYFLDSYIKSLVVLIYGKKYFSLLQSEKFKIIVLTNFHKKFLINLKISNDRILVIPNAIEINKNIKPALNSNYMIYGGRVSKEKGVEELVKTFLSCNFSDIHLKIVGSGPYFHKLKKRYICDSIDFVDEVNNHRMLQYIANSKGVVTATKLFEGQPTLLCEASNMGIPSIFPKTGGIEEFFPENYSLSFKQYDYLDLKMKLNELENLEKVKIIGSKNMEFINNKLDPTRMIKTFEEIING